MVFDLTSECVIEQQTCAARGTFSEACVTLERALDACAIVVDVDVVQDFNALTAALVNYNMKASF